MDDRIYAYMVNIGVAMTYNWHIITTVGLWRDILWLCCVYIVHVGCQIVGYG